MRILSLVILGLLIIFISLFSASSHVTEWKTPLDNPHGKDLTISCTVCHNSKGWALDKAIYSFDHASTKMPLTGEHSQIDCKTCHTTLVFSNEKAKNQCIHCHTDIHSQTVGNFCDKCHTPTSWIVNNITDIHQQSRLPLLGVHTITECQLCHKSESLHRYSVLGVECMDCHRDKYMATTRPSHLTANFPTDCAQCHYIFSYEWTGAGFNHSFFPLTQGHANVDCALCHVNNNYSNISTECVSCHLNDYNTANYPMHNCFPKNCVQCHTTSPGWTPVNFNHEQYFPIISGNHSGISCNQCHTNPADCGTFNCLTCHPQGDMDHNGVGGFQYNSPACYSCHPQGTD